MTAAVAPSAGPSRSGGASARPASILAAETVSRRFRARGGARRGDAGEVRAVEAVSLEVRTGETLGLVGESGSGKSTLGRLLVGLETPDEGRVLFDGAPIAGLRRAGALRFRRAVQVVFQDPYASLNPRLKVGAMLREILQVHGIARGPEAGERVERLLERVGLDADAARRHPHEFSGGQRQRVGIARALVVDPRIIIADEPVSALDVSVQAKILGLLGELQRDLGLGYLFISHDLAVVRGIAHRVAVMRKGRIVESGPAEGVFADPGHEYTRSLLAAVPRLPRPA